MAVNWNWHAILAWFGLVAPVEPSGICLCGHPEEVHEHYRAGSDCGVCGRRQCPRYRDNPDAVDWDAVCADHQVIEAVRADDLDYALTIAPSGLVAALVALRDEGRAAA